MDLINSSIAQLAVVLEHELLLLHGPLMSGEPLRIALGYRSKDAFRQAVARKTVPITVFAIAKRKGKFALTKEVAAWIARQRECATTQPEQKEGGSP